MHRHVHQPWTETLFSYFGNFVVSKLTILGIGLLCTHLCQLALDPSIIGSNYFFSQVNQCHGFLIYLFINMYCLIQPKWRCHWALLCTGACIPKMFLLNDCYDSYATALNLPLLLRNTNEVKFRNNLPLNFTLSLYPSFCRLLLE